jgi:hypothetical protein
LWLPTLLAILFGTRFVIVRLIRLRLPQTSEPTQSS